MTTSIRLHIHTLKRVLEYYILLLPKSQDLFGILSCFALFLAHYNDYRMSKHQKLFRQADFIGLKQN